MALLKAQNKKRRHSLTGENWLATCYLEVVDVLVANVVATNVDVVVTNAVATTSMLSCGRVACGVRNGAHALPRSPHAQLRQRKHAMCAPVA